MKGTLDSGSPADAIPSGLGPEDVRGPFGITVGWYNVAVSLLVTMLIVGSTSYSYGLFVKPVAAEFHLGRAEVNIGLILFQIGSAIYSPFIGRIADRFPARTVIRAGGLLAGGGLLTIGLTSSLPLIAFATAVPIALGAGSVSLAGIVAVSRSFTRRRGRALMISAIGTSAGGLLAFPMIALLYDHFGWRNALIIAGIAIIVVVWLLCMFVWEAPESLYKAPQDARGPVPANGGVKEPVAVASTVDREWRVAELLRDRDFWLIAAAVALMLGVDGAALATVTPYALDRGFSLTNTTLLMTAATGSAIAGKLIIAWLIDNMDLRVLIAITGFFAAVLCLTLLLEAPYLVLIAVCATTGIAIGGTYPLSNAIVARRFGVVSLGVARGLMFPLTSAMIAVCLYLVGALHDIYGDYRNAFAILGAAALAAIVLIWFTRRQPLPPTSKRGGIGTELVREN